MDFLYHGVPQQMIGSTLIPLNQMEGELAATRSHHLKKYEGREGVKQKRIPLLNCLWNDVVQFLPLNPQSVFELQRELGIIPQVPPYKFYKILVDSLAPEHTVVFRKTAPGDENTEVNGLPMLTLHHFKQFRSPLSNITKV